MSDSPFEFSDALVAWSRQARFTFTPTDSTGAAVFWSDPGGEIRFYVRGDGDWFALWSADRASTESWVLSAASLGLLSATSSIPSAAESAPRKGCRG
jgi:hypothetical protein